MNTPTPENMRGEIVVPTGQMQRGGSGMSAGVMQSQARELAELRNQYLMAQEFPRNELQSIDAVARAFSEPYTAEAAQYQYSRGGTDIAGPSIDAAQQLALCWGNISHGWREIARGTDENGKRYSELEAYAVDLQSRVPARLTFVNMHWRDTKGGGYPLREERDIYEANANAAQRRKRACILSVMPKHVIEIAMTQAALTLKTRADTSPEAMAVMVDSFKAFGITRAQIEARIQRRIEAIQPAHVVSLRRIFKSLSDGVAVPSDFFAESEPGAEAANDATGQPASAAEKIKSKLKGKVAKTPTSDERAARGGVGEASSEPPATTPASALRDALMHAKDKDAALEVLDRGRDLDDLEREALAQLFEQRFPDE